MFEDPTKEAMDYYRRTKIFPIMHIVGIRRTLAEAHPWLPMALLKAFERSKRMALEKLADTSATKVMLPFVEEQLRRAHAFMGEDFWPYGLPANATRSNISPGITTRRAFPGRAVAVDELFHPGTVESFKI